MTNEKGMEMPIAVMITLFVAIAVALIVINFAGELIGMGQTQMRQFALDSSNADFFVEVSSAGSNTVASLASQCYKSHKGAYGMDTICYIVHATTDVSFGEVDVLSRFLEINPDYDMATMGEPINFEKWDGVGKTVYIKFDELKQAISIES